MRKEFVVKSINASPDGPQHVIVLLTSAKDLQEQNQHKSRFDPSDMMNPDKMKNMVNDLNKMFSGMGGGGITEKMLEKFWKIKDINDKLIIKFSQF